MKKYLFITLILLSIASCRIFDNTLESYTNLEHLDNEKYGLFVPDDNGKEFHHFSDKMLTYMLSEQPAISSENIKRISIVKENSQKIVRIDFDKEGARLLKDITEKYLHRKIAIVADGKVISAPVVMHPVKGGSISITGLTGEEISQITKNLSPKQ